MKLKFPTEPQREAYQTLGCGGYRLEILQTLGSPEFIHSCTVRIDCSEFELYSLDLLGYQGMKTC